MPEEATTARAGTSTGLLLDDLLDRALDHMAAGDPAAAIAPLEAALTLDPAHPAATHALLRALDDAGRPDDALALVHRHLADSPDDVLAHTRLSILLQKLGRIPEAEAAATRAKLLDWKRQLNSSI